MTNPVTLWVPASALKSDIISIGVSIGRWIFSRYFPPSVFEKFDKDYKLTEIIIELFSDKPEAIAVLEQQGPQLETEINKRNTRAILLGNSRVDFKWYIEERLWKESPAFQVFQVLLERICKYEEDEKQRVLALIDNDTKLSEDDYLFIFGAVLHMIAVSIRILWNFISLLETRSLKNT